MYYSSNCGKLNYLIENKKIYCPIDRARKTLTVYLAEKTSPAPKVGVLGLTLSSLSWNLKRVEFLPSPLLPGPLGPVVVGSIRVLSVCQIDVSKNYLYSIGTCTKSHFRNNYTKNVNMNVQKRYSLTFRYKITQEGWHAFKINKPTKMHLITQAISNL